MYQCQLEQRITQDDYIITWLDGFLIDRKSQNLSTGTIGFYREKLNRFVSYADSQLIKHIGDITPDTIRQYLIYLESTGHNAGGIHAHYRSLKAFLLWYEDEMEPDNWRNPIRKVKPPRVDIEPLQGVETETFQKLLGVCKKSRDYALLCLLFDTGCRAQEVLDIRIENINAVTGQIVIQRGKGGKPRIVFLGKTSRKAVRKYLNNRIENSRYLFVTNGGEKLTYTGLRQIIIRLAKKAGIEPPSLHSFRRGFCLEMLRNGTDIFTLQALMGHSSLSVLQRYLKITPEDLHNSHIKSSPVDNRRLNNDNNY